VVLYGNSFRPPLFFRKFLTTVEINFSEAISSQIDVHVKDPKLTGVALESISKKGEKRYQSRGINDFDTFKNLNKKAGNKNPSNSLYLF